MLSEAVTSDSLTKALDALRNPRRRRLLARLHDTAPGASVEVAELHDGDDDFAIALYHVHLPKLEAAGYVEVTRHPMVVYRGPNFEEVAAVMRVLEANASELPGEWP